MYKKIMVPVDGSAASLRGLDEALRLSKTLGAALSVAHVVNEFIMDTSYAPAQFHDGLIDTLRETGRRVLADAQSIAREHGVNCSCELIETIGGRAADAIVKHARDWSADLIVMGTHGRRGLSRLAMGSDAELVLRSTPVPVLLVRAPDAD